MMSVQPNTFHFVIPNPSNTQILIRSPQTDHLESKYQLPCVSPPKDDECETPWVNAWNEETDDLCRVALVFLDLHIYVRDIAWLRLDGPDGCEEAVLIADLRNPDVIPSPYFWASLEQVNQFTWEHIHSQVEIPKLVLSVLDANNLLPSGLTGCVQDNDAEEQGLIRDFKGWKEPVIQPWRRQGWLAEMESWLISATSTRSLRICPEACLTQMKNNHHSTLLQCQVQTTDDTHVPCREQSAQRSEFTVYLKQSCVNLPKALITNAVASCFPDLVPEILAVKDDCTFLQVKAANLGGYYQYNVMKTLANMQVRSIQSRESLQAGGVPYRGLDWHAHNIAKILRHPALKPLQSEESYVSLADCVDDFRALLAELAAYKIPHTLVHGDFCFENILEDGSETELPRFIAWGSACIGHPFVDFVRIVDLELDGVDKKVAKDVYLSCWERFESSDNIARALRLAYPVLLCDNLYIMLQQYDAANLIERQCLGDTLKGCVSGLSNAIANLRDRFERYEGDEGSSLIISKNNGRLILAKQSDHMLSLPSITAFGITQVTDRELDGRGMCQVVRAQIGIESRIVRGLWVRHERMSVPQKMAVVLEALDVNEQIPTGYVWAGDKDIESFSDRKINSSDGHPRQEQSVVTQYFSGSADQYGISQNTSWRHFGWLTRTSEWLDRSLTSKGLQRVGGLQEVKTDSFGTVWKCSLKRAEKRNTGTQYEDVQQVFVKSLVSRSEGRLLSVMSTFVSGLVPFVVESDPSSNTFVMTDVGQANEDELDWFLLCKVLGLVQTRSIEYMDQLREAGLHEYNCNWVKCNTKRLLNEARLLTQEESRIVSCEQAFEADDVIRCVDELELLNMPLTLVHGDLHPGNIGSRIADGHRIYDWASAFVGHPLCDFAVLTKMSGAGVDDKEAAQKGYLSAWDAKWAGSCLTRATDLALVYYWMVNLEVLLQEMKMVAVVDCGFVKKRLAQTIRYLGTAVDSVLNSKE